MMPQWDFLNFLAKKGSAYPSFLLEMQAEAIDLVFDEGRVAGVVAETASGRQAFRADLVVAADGRGSIAAGEGRPARARYWRADGCALVPSR